MPRSAATKARSTAASHIWTAVNSRARTSRAVFRAEPASAALTWLTLAQSSTDVAPFVRPLVIRVRLGGEHAIGGRMLLGMAAERLMGSVVIVFAPPVFEEDPGFAAETSWTPRSSLSPGVVTSSAVLRPMRASLQKRPDRLGDSYHCGADRARWPAASPQP